MDINLTEMSGTEATRLIREIEKDHGKIRTNIIAVSIDAKQQSDLGLFDHYSKNFLFIQINFFQYFLMLVEKPIKSMERLSQVIKAHFLKNRKDIIFS